MEPARQDDAAGVVRDVPAYGIEARRWTVVFHRRAENRFFGVIAMGRFKHVSAFAFIPELGFWVVFNVGFRRTRIEYFADTDYAKTVLAHLVKGNCMVTMEVREDNLPWFRPGLFCTTAVAHLVGLRCVAARPDALYRLMVKAGGVVCDDGTFYTPKKRDAQDRRRSELRDKPGAGAALAD